MEPQRETIEFLSTPYAHGGLPVERVDTHASIVFLAGDTAYKLKRAVRYDYLDFSTPERRKAMCEAELTINRRTAPQIYQRVVPVTRDEPGALAIDGTGTPVDWLLVMRRFDQAQLLDRLAASGGLALETMTALGHAIVRMHDGAERCAARGGAASMAWVVEGNARDFAARSSFDAGLAAELTTRARAALAMHAAGLDDRQGRGFVRRCHGDLHLRNIVLLDGAPTPFDAVEFNDDISCIDVLYDLAFLLMDLWRRSLRAHANAVFNAYVGDTGHVDGLALLPLFLSCRAAVRAKTGATTAALENDPVKRRELEQTAAGYLALARQLLEPPPARLVAVGGLSGTGKSSLARRLAPAVGAAPGCAGRAQRRTPQAPGGGAAAVAAAVRELHGRRLRAGLRVARPHRGTGGRAGPHCHRGRRVFSGVGTRRDRSRRPPRRCAVPGYLARGAGGRVRAARRESSRRRVGRRRRCRAARSSLERPVRSGGCGWTRRETRVVSL